MLQVIKGLKSLLPSLIIFTLVYFFTLESENFWLKYHRFIETLLIGLLISVILFSSYFNRSRIALISALWLFYFTGQQHNPALEQWLTSHSNLITHSIIFTLSLFIFMKDRALLSIHGVYRVILIFLCILFAYLWQQSSLLGDEYFVASNNFQIIKPYVELELPLALCLFVGLFRCIKTPNLVNSAIFITMIFWLVEHFQWHNLSFTLALTLLTFYYILVVVIDSYLLAYRDDLTGLPSRRALNQLALSLGQKYTVAMLDIDHFKKFNDTYGHDIGDQVLKLVAAKIGKVKGGGKAFRYGGEEFTIVFPRKSTEHAVDHLESVRQAIQDYDIVIRQPQRQTKQARKKKKASSNKGNVKTVSVTISIGVAQRHDKQSFEQALKSSDQALYKAKKKGRNNVSV